MHKYNNTGKLQKKQSTTCFLNSKPLDSNIQLKIVRTCGLREAFGVAHEKGQPFEISKASCWQLGSGVK
jgi:hypothetical protein